MQDFGTKADNSPPPGGQLSAAEFNNLATENENAVLHSGQSLSGTSDNQLAQSLFLHGVKSDSFQDSGAANAYVATPVSGASGVLLPASYAQMDGATISFKASNANSGASTLNIGQTTGTLLGAKAIVDQAGSPIIGGVIFASAYVQLKYDASIGAGSWVLLPWAVNHGRLINVQIFNASGTYTPIAGTRSVVVEVLGGGGGGGGAQATAAGQTAAGGGGGGGGYAKSIINTGFSGATVTIGAGGGGGAIAGAGSSGGTTSFGASLTATGGGGGNAGLAATPPGQTAGGAGGQGSLGNIANTAGFFGGRSTSMSAANAISGEGGGTVLGGGAAPRGSASPGIGLTAMTSGAGGGGALAGPSSAGFTGGAGANGIAIVYAYS